MDSTPGSAKRSRPTDSPAKGQPKSKIAAQDISPADQADSSPDMEAAKRADRPPGLLQWEEEKKAMQAQISQLMHQTNLQAGFIQAQAAEFNRRPSSMPPCYKWTPNSMLLLSGQCSKFSSKSTTPYRPAPRAPPRP